MRAIRHITPIILIGIAALSSASAVAEPTSRDSVLIEIKQGKTDFDAGRFADAASIFERAINDGQESPDLRAIAGVFLCLARAKNEQLDAARAACRNVLDMPDAPQAIKDQATKLLGKLN